MDNQLQLGSVRRPHESVHVIVVIVLLCNCGIAPSSCSLENGHGGFRDPGSEKPQWPCGLREQALNSAPSKTCLFSEDCLFALNSFLRLVNLHASDTRPRMPKHFVRLLNASPSSATSLLQTRNKSHQPWQLLGTFNPTALSRTEHEPRALISVLIVAGFANEDPHSSPWKKTLTHNLTRTILSSSTGVPGTLLLIRKTRGMGCLLE